MGQNVWIKSGKTMNLLPTPQVNNAAAVTGAYTGAWVYKDSPTATFQASVYGTGAVTATVTIQYSNDGISPVQTGSTVISLSGTGAAYGSATVSDGAATTAPWKFCRAVVSSPTGTITQISVTMGV